MAHVLTRTAGVVVLALAASSGACTAIIDGELAARRRADGGEADAGMGFDAGRDGGGGCVSYRDSDEDGAGDPSVTAFACPPPPGYVENADDCDDTTELVRPGATELCNAVDDDCDGTRDDDFECEQNGTGVACTTACGSTGVGSCDASCNATSCMPPPESCNYADDDCDGVVDQGVQSLSTPTSYSTTSEAVRTWTFGGEDPLVLTVYRGGAITARRFDASGAPTGTEAVIFTVALELELANFILGFARAGDRLFATLPNADGTAVEARAFSTSDFSAVGAPLTLGTPTEVQSAQIAADGDSILIAYVGNDGAVRLRATDGMLVPRGDASTVATNALPPVALATRAGSLDWWLAYTGQVGMDAHTFVQKVRPSGILVGPAIDTATSARTALLPEIALAEDGTLAVLEGRRTGSTYVLGLQTRGVDGALLSDLELPGEWGFCVYFAFPYCRPASATWTGSRWLVTRVALGMGVQETRAQVVGADGSAVLEDVLLASSMDQLRTSSAARLAGGATLVTVPTPAAPLRALWGCN
jgi:hypothetical protein